MTGLRGAGAVQAATDMSHRVRVERVQVLFRQAPPAIFISATIGVLVSIALWDTADQRLLTTWLAFLVTIALVRLLLVIVYARAGPDRKASAAFEGWFVGSALVVGAVWGAGGWLLMPQEPLAYQALLYFFLMGLASGAVATYGSDAKLVTASVSLVMLPATIRLVTIGTTPLDLMALGGIIYTLAAYRATSVMSSSLRRSQELSYELAIANARAQELARTDELTGMNNRRAFLELAEHSLQQASRYDRPASMILLDVDRFKGINDAHGHLAGDDVLRALADVVRGTIRASDIAGRVGGEEFAILLPETGEEDAAVMAERLRAGFAARPVATARGVVRFTASFGVAERDPRQSTVDALVARADGALYQAKGAGRDRVVLSRAGHAGGQTAG